MVNQIILRKTNTEWTIRYVDDKDIIDTFGADEMLTPFFSNMPEELVVKAIREVNPGVTITIRA